MHRYVFSILAIVSFFLFFYATKHSYKGAKHSYKGAKQSYKGTKQTYKGTKQFYKGANVIIDVGRWSVRPDGGSYYLRTNSLVKLKTPTKVKSFGQSDLATAG